MLDLGTLRYFAELGLSVARDDEKDKPNHWYVIPDAPTWHTRKDDKDPSKTIVDFSFVKVMRPGQKTATDPEDRAFFSFTTQLAPAKELLDQLRKKDGELSGATFLTPWFTETKAELGIYAKPTKTDDSRVFVKSVTHLLTPQRFGAALCPFQVELGEYGSPVMEALLTNAEDSGLQVGYEVKQLVRLPQSEITAEIYGKTLVEATQRWVSSKSKSIWGESGTSEDTKKDGAQTSGDMPDSFDAVIKQQLAPSIHVRWVSNPFTKDAEAKVRTSIENWIFTLLEQQLRKLPGVDEAMNTLRGKRPDDPGIGIPLETLHKRLEIKGDGPLFQARYTSSESVEYTWVASGSLPGIGTLVPKVREKGEERRRYFLEVFANDPFFAQRPVTVSFTDNITKLSNPKIEGSLSMPAVPGAGVVDFAKKQITEDFKFDTGFSPVRVKLPLREDVDSQYRRVTLDVYLSGSMSGQAVNVHHRKTLTEQDADRVDLTFADIGLFQRTLDPTLLTFGTGPKELRKASVRCRFRSAEGKELFARSYDFNKDKTVPQDLFFSLPQQSREGALEYFVQYVYGDGTYRWPIGEGCNLCPADTLLIPTFFLDRPIDVVAQELKAPSKDQLQVTLLYESEHHQDSTTFYLKAGENRKTTTLRTIRGEGGLFVSSFLIREGVKPIALLDKEEYSFLQTVNLDLQPTFPVYLDLSRITDDNWGKIDQLEVEVKVISGGEGRPKKFKIDQKKDVKPLSFNFSNPDELSVHWKASFFLTDDSEKRQEGDEALSGAAFEGITIQPSFRRAEVVKS